MSTRDWMERLWSRPLAEQLPERMRERGVSYRELSALTYEAAAKAGEKGVSFAYLINIAKARARPTPRAIELIAEALDFPPEQIPDYRLGRLRAYLDDRHEAEALQRFLELEAQLVEDARPTAVGRFVRETHARATST